MSLERVLAGKRVCICAGAGGVGKTTTAAAVALGLAARGGRVAVVTIDPAQRLADALGVAPLGNDPQLVDPRRFAGGGVRIEGELWAMTLDAKRTFDELIERLAPDAATRDAIMANRIYQELSTAVGGSQEFSAIAKLHELDQSRRFDVIVLDTPPSRNALDFLDAPNRLVPFLQSRAMRVLMAPTGVMASVAASGTGLALGALRRLTGAELLDDLAALLAALSKIADGLSVQASEVDKLLTDRTSAFLLVTSPERLSVDETVFLVHRLKKAGAGISALVINRVHALSHAREDPDPEGLAASLGGDRALADKAFRTLGELRGLAARDASGIEQLRAGLGDVDPIRVPDLERPVHDVDGLIVMHRHLFATATQQSRLLEQAAF